MTTMMLATRTVLICVDVDVVLLVFVHDADNGDGDDHGDDGSAVVTIMMNSALPLCVYRSPPSVSNTITARTSSTATATTTTLTKTTPPTTTRHIQKLQPRQRPLYQQLHA